MFDSMCCFLITANMKLVAKYMSISADCKKELKHGKNVPTHVQTI